MAVKTKTNGARKPQEPKKTEFVLGPEEMAGLRELEQAQKVARIELANLVIMQQQAMHRVVAADQAYQERVAHHAKVLGLDLSGKAGRWNFNTATGAFTSVG